MVVGCSVHQVNTCLNIHKEHGKKQAYKEILEQVESVGSMFWDTMDGKKKPGQTERKKNEAESKLKRASMEA
jgi:hypothetical protein